MWKKIKGFGAWMLSLGGLVLLMVLAMLFIHGGVWLGENIYPWLLWASAITLLVCVFVLLPLSFLKTGRAFAGNGLVIASLLFGFSLWVWGLILTYNLWGPWAVFIGLFFLGIGVVPIAFLAATFKGMWSTLGDLAILTFLTFGCRAFGLYVLSKINNQAYDS